MASMASQSSSKPLLLDVTALETGSFSLTNDSLILDDAILKLNDGGMGWLRRYAPSSWGIGVVAGSIESAIHRSFLTLVGSLNRLGNRQWLTRIDEMLRAEDRLVQLEVAASVSIDVPRSIVTSDAQRAVDELGNRFIVKPLSLGYFSTPSGPMAVYANALDSKEALRLNFGGAPFIAQELVAAESHYRIVTVRENAWVAKLSAEGRPIDWRQQTRAHYEWEPATDDDCAKKAIELAQAFGLGYSSQDWLVKGSQRFFIDLNPGGQWLFLPNVIASDVTKSIARFLIGGL
jgi:hypothetical protein